MWIIYQCFALKFLKENDYETAKVKSKKLVSGQIFKKKALKKQKL